MKLGPFVAAAGLLCSAAPAVAQDTTALRRALVTAMDSTRSLTDRALALRLLRPVAWEPAREELVALAQPYLVPWVIWHGALSALAEYRAQEMAVYWRDMITFPRRPVREIAIRGLARTGLETDREFLRAQTRRETDADMIRLAAWADSMLQQRRKE